MGPSEELGTLQNGQKWFTWSLVRNGFPPFLRIIQTGREDPGGRKENFYNRTLALASRSTLTWESKVSYAKANVLGLGDCRFMSIRKHCKPVKTNKGSRQKKNTGFFWLFVKRGAGGSRPIQKILIRKYSDFFDQGGGGLTQSKRVLSEKLRFFGIIYQKRRGFKKNGIFWPFIAK